MKDTTCPYCGADVEINHDDGYGYEEDQHHNQECRSCGKTFLYTTSISFWYETEKTECLNGGGHDFEKIDRYGSGGKVEILKCISCGHEHR